MSWLDESGFTHFWQNLKALFASKSDVGHTHSDLEARISALESGLKTKQDKIQAWDDLKSGGFKND